MARDMLMRGNDRQELVDWGLRNNVILQETDDEGNTTNVLRRGFYWSPWNGTGNFMRTPGDDTTSSTYLNGYFVLFRFGDDRMDEYQQLVDVIKFEGQPGNIDGINFYRWDGIEFCSGEDADQACDQWGVPRHEWAGGNVYGDPDESALKVGHV